MSPERALDLRAKIADYRRGAAPLDIGTVCDVLLDLLDGKDTLPSETLTLRDQFALAALPGILFADVERFHAELFRGELPPRGQGFYRRTPGLDYEGAAEVAYRMADAMLEARKPPGDEEE